MIKKKSELIFLFTCSMILAIISVTVILLETTLGLIEALHIGLIAFEAIGVVISIAAITILIDILFYIYLRSHILFNNYICNQSGFINRYMIYASAISVIIGGVVVNIISNF